MRVMGAPAEKLSPPPAGLAPDDSAWFNTGAHMAAVDVIRSAITSALDGPMNVEVTDGDGTHRQHVTLVDAPAGAGKTQLVTNLARQAVDSRVRLLVVTPGNDQLGELARRTSRALSGTGKRLGVLHRAGELQDVSDMLRASGVVVTTDADDVADAHVVICTLHKLRTVRYSWHPKDLGCGAWPFGLAVVDEAYQASGPVFAAVAATSRRILLVGDPAQLKPFSTDPYAAERRGLAEDPLHSAASYVVARFGDVIARFRLPITRRLPPAAVPVARLFYPEHHFDGWVLPQTRLVDRSVVPVDPLGRIVQATLAEGWAHVRLPGDATVDDADPETADVIADLAAAATVGNHRLASETTDGAWAPLTAGRVAVLVTYNAQRLLVEAALGERLPGGLRPTVGTANSLQGLEFDLTIVWYPLAGQASFEAFRGDPGRLAVMLTRHRHGCAVVGRASDAAIFEEDVPPLGELDMSFSDPVTTGWLTHMRVLRQLERYQRESPAIS